MPSPDTPADPAPNADAPDATPEPAPDADAPRTPEAGPEADGPDASADDVDARETVAEANEHEAEAGAFEEEPSLRAHLAETWHSTPPLVRWGAVALAVLVVGWLIVPRVIEATEGPTEEERQEQAARDRAMWAAMLRQSPTEVGADPVAGSLGPGDAERTDDRYADYYVHQADSVGFSVLVTSDAFAPDVAVRLPDGTTVAASSLLQTDSRAEIDGLQGPGRFEIVVTSRRARATGAYELAVLPQHAADSVYVDGEARLDTLGGGPRRAGRFERIYGVSTDTDLPILVRVVSSAFRPRIELLGPNGRVRDDSWSLEQIARGDSLYGVVARYLPGWEAPYRLLVSSEGAGASGPFALEAISVPIRDLAVGEAGQRSVLGDESWLRDGRYLDTYRVRVPKGQRTTIRLESEAFAPAFRVWRVQRQSRTDVTEAMNEAGAEAVEYEAELDEGEYYIEVTSGGEDPDEVPEAPVGGEYGLTALVERLEPLEEEPSTGEPPSGSRVFATEVRRTGESGGDTFEVGVTNVAISYPGTRTRVQLSVTVRSIDYTGNWAPWESFARQSYLVDDRGRRYTVAVGESQSPSGPRAEPGTARRGTVVFYYPEAVGGLERVVLVASIGERTLTLPIPME
ncbi:hypothetical protein [Rubrivirga marina]|uniref:Uncharacterized protein n=1 Tax=Rubrivirga marina TaxID=1196024 RepID=A0A271IZM1_9BACT|nr:hypothetical protein [Rubrivirga marina]PAP76438.1 hypothetical protein BSZ37_08285 [Rubrivirga marina]